MKKLLLSAIAFAFFGVASAQDGQFKAGVNLGLPLGDIKEYSTFVYGIDAAYTWEISDEFKAGAATGYLQFLGKTVEAYGVSITAPSVGYIPLAGTAQYSITENLFLGADLGFALRSGNSRENGGGGGGLYYQPKFGFQTEKIEVYAGYKGISVSSGSFSSIGLGFNYKF